MKLIGILPCNAAESGFQGPITLEIIQKLRHVTRRKGGYNLVTLCAKAKLCNSVTYVSLGELFN